MTNRFFPLLLGRPSLRLARSDLALRGGSRPRALGALAALALAAAPTMLAPTLASADPTCTTSGSTTTCIFSSTGSEQTFTVPAGVSSVTVTAVGGVGAAGQGSDLGSSGGAGGFGAKVTGALSVTGGEVLYVEVAGNAPNPAGSAAGGFNGGGAGGDGCIEGGGG